MLRNHLKIAWHNIVKHKGYALINILGLGVGIAVCLFIYLWVQDELSFDRFHQDRDRIFRVVSSWERQGWEGLEVTPAPLAPAMEKEIPEVIHAARCVSHARLVFQYKNKRFYEERGLITDPSFFQIFTFPFLQGELGSAFQNPTDMVITESMGRKYFGEENPMGKTIQVEGRSCTITGVIRDIPENSHLQFDFVSSFEFMRVLGYGYGTSWHAFNFTTYVKTLENPDLIALGEKITRIGARNKSAQVAQGLSFDLQPLNRVYLTARDWDIKWRILGNRKIVWLFSLIALFVLTIACVNFMNLSTARSASRSREVGMRKAAGARRGQLIRQFFTESIFLTLISVLLALALVMALLPHFNRLSGKSLSLNPGDPSFVLGVGLILIFTGVLAGLYPAVFLSGFSPKALFQGFSSSDRRGFRFRRILVVFQFAISILLILGTLGFNRQFRYIQERDLGFDRQNVIFIPIKENVGTRYPILKTELLRHSEILSVSAQYMHLTDTWRGAGWDWEGRDPKRDRNLDLILSGVEYDFFKTLGLQIVEGRSFSQENSSDYRNSVILNRSAVREMGLDSPLGKWFRLSDDRMAQIIGIAADANFQSLRQKIANRIFFITDISEETGNGIVLIRMQSGKIAEGIAVVRRAWESMNPVSPFEFHFVDETYDSLYAAEMRAARIFNVFTLLAIAISSLGLLGLSSFMAEKRTKEIGIRKVLGASARRLIFMMGQEFLRWVLVANLIAWPLGYLLMKRVLSMYAYRVSIEISLFILSGVIALGVALATVWYQACRAARANPVESLRYE